MHPIHPMHPMHPKHPMYPHVFHAPMRPCTPMYPMHHLQVVQGGACEAEGAGAGGPDSAHSPCHAAPLAWEDQAGA